MSETLGGCATILRCIVDSYVNPPFSAVFFRRGKQSEIATPALARLVETDFHG